jgi:hypothetical protein
MIVFLTAPAHDYTVAPFCDGRYGQGLPRIRRIDYTKAFWARELPVATYVFTDFERLYPWEQICAAALYRSLRDLGQRCLNDPARAMTRFELLRGLHRAGINPFNVYRADDDPRPARFPVFVRTEAGHDAPVTGLLADAAALSSALQSLSAAGWPRRLLLVVEFCAAPIARDVWRKNATMRIGDKIFPLNNVTENNWVVKYGTAGLATSAMHAEEFVGVHANGVAGNVRAAFELAGLDYGRADHAPGDGGHVIYEINSNPNLTPSSGQLNLVREATMRQCAVFVTAALHEIDTLSSGSLAPPPNPMLPQRQGRRDFLVKRR